MPYLYMNLCLEFVNLYFLTEMNASKVSFSIELQISKHTEINVDCIQFYRTLALGHLMSLENCTELI